MAAITRAKPDIADYPFTTLMPNLGRLDGDPSLGPGQYSSETTLADLPGLIEGAHLGKVLLFCGLILQQCRLSLLTVMFPSRVLVETS